MALEYESCTSKTALACSVQPPRRAVISAWWSIPRLRSGSEQYLRSQTPPWARSSVVGLFADETSIKREQRGQRPANRQ
jgi:hypothetical protein